jgi:hypothetical protein
VIVRHASCPSRRVLLGANDKTLIRKTLGSVSEILRAVARQRGLEFLVLVRDEAAQVRERLAGRCELTSQERFALDTRLNPPYKVTSQVDRPNGTSPFLDVTITRDIHGQSFTRSRVSFVPQGRHGLYTCRPGGRNQAGDDRRHQHRDGKQHESDRITWTDTHQQARDVRGQYQRADQARS